MISPLDRTSVKSPSFEIFCQSWLYMATLCLGLPLLLFVFCIGVMQSFGV